MEVYLFAGRRVSSRTPGRNDRLQDAAGALGQGADSGLQENTSAGIKERRIAAPENRSLVSPDRHPELSADDCAFSLADAGHDYSLLPGLVPDALHCPATFYGIDVLDFQLLPGFAKGIVSEKLAAIAALPAPAHVSRNRADGYQYARRPGSAGGQADCFCPHAEVPRRIEEGQSGRQEISQAPRMGPLD